MTVQSDLKRLIRDRQQKTGESYTTARQHVMRARAELLGRVPEPQGPARFDAVVLKVNAQSARVRLLGEVDEVTFRSRRAHELVPGQVAALTFEKRWAWRGDAYASGDVESARIDIAALGLEPLPLHGGELDPIAWGEFPGDDPEDNLTCDAAELREAGDEAGARALLMAALHRDLRCIDAHAALGNIEFDRAPGRAIVHYEIGIGIAELSLPRPFDGLLEWGSIYNRPLLRCLHGYGLCLWRLGRIADAERVFLRILSLNPNDHQGVRDCLADVRAGRSWDAAVGDEEAGP